MSVEQWNTGTKAPPCESEFEDSKVAAGECVNNRPGADLEFGMRALEGLGDMRGHCPTLPERLEYKGNKRLLRKRAKDIWIIGSLQAPQHSVEAAFERSSKDHSQKPLGDRVASRLTVTPKSVVSRGCSADDVIRTLTQVSPQDDGARKDCYHGGAVA